MNHMKIDGQYVAQLRTQHGWSQEQLAEISDLGIRTVQRIEAEGQCSLESRNALAAAFDLSGNALSDGPNKAAITAFIGRCQVAILCAYFLCVISLWVTFGYRHYVDGTVTETTYRVFLLLAPVLCSPIILGWNWVAGRWMRDHGIEPKPTIARRLLSLSLIHI